MLGRQNERKERPLKWMDRWFGFYGPFNNIGHIEPGSKWREMRNMDETLLWTNCILLLQEILTMVYMIQKYMVVCVIQPHLTQCDTVVYSIFTHPYLGPSIWVSFLRYTKSHTIRHSKISKDQIISGKHTYK